jgi:hypothetical protein
MDLFSFLSFHFMCVTVTVVTGHSVALSRRPHLFSMMSSLHDVLMHDIYFYYLSLAYIQSISSSCYISKCHYNLRSNCTMQQNYNMDKIKIQKLEDNTRIATSAHPKF